MEFVDGASLTCAQRGAADFDTAAALGGLMIYVYIFCLYGLVYTCPISSGQPLAVRISVVCSHWWGEPIKDFVLCVEKDFEVRYRTHEFDDEDNFLVNAPATYSAEPSDANHWVCAYANLQHALNQELVEDPK